MNQKIQVSKTQTGKKKKFKDIYKKIRDRTATHCKIFFDSNKILDIPVNVADK